MRPTSLEQQLTPQQQEEFYQRCLQTKGGFTGPIVTAIAADFGLRLPARTANRVRHRFLARRHAELREHADTARAFAVAAQHGLGLNDAAAVKLSLKINDDLDSSTALSIEEKNRYSLAISRLRAGDQRRQTIELLQTRLELQQFDAVAAAIKHTRAIRTVVTDPTLATGEKTERVRKILFGERPKDWAPITAEGERREAEPPSLGLGEPTNDHSE